jgi:hypothetical protein
MMNNGHEIITEAIERPFVMKNKAFEGNFSWRSEYGT